MTAEIEVWGAVDEQELAVGGGDATVGVVDLGRRVDAGELGEDEGHDRTLEEAGDDLSRGVGEQGGAMPLDLTEAAGERAGLVEGVGVGKEDALAAGELRPSPARVVFAREAAASAGVEGWGIEEGYGGTGVGGGMGVHGRGGDVAGGVGGGIIDDNELPLAAEGKAGLGLLHE